MENKTVFCPVLQRQVNGDDCFDISTVSYTHLTLPTIA